MTGKHNIAHGHENDNEPESHPGWPDERVVLAAMVILFLASVLAKTLLGSDGVTVTISYIMCLLGVTHMLPKVAADVRRRRFTMNLLTVVATVAGAAVGEPFEASMVIFLYLVGEEIEDWAEERASDALSAMEDLMPSKAHVVMHDGEVIDMPVQDVAVGEVVRVLVGERVPFDGTIIRGASEFDESHVSGESVPVARSCAIRSDVVAGALSMSGITELRVTADADGSTVSRIAEMTREAKSGKVPNQSLLDEFAECYTPVVGIIALIVAIGIPTAMTLAGMAPDWSEWLRRGVSMLVIGCPCSIVIGVPITFVSGICALARNGVVVNGAGVIERASKIERVMLDKTGTVTTGDMAVRMEVVCDDGMREPCLEAVRALESESNHPIAYALTSYAGSQITSRCSDVAVWDVREIIGQGMEGHVDGMVTYVGRIPTDGHEGLEVPSGLVETMADIEREGLTPIVAALDGTIALVFGVGSELQENARRNVSWMGRLTGVMPTILTGDSLNVARAIARQVGLDGTRQVFAELTPEQKMERILVSQSDGKTTMMVGDGVNDAPALASADVGLAVGSSRSDVSFGVADAIAMGNPLQGACVLISISRKVTGTAWACLVLSVVAKVVASVLIMSGVMGMGTAVFADTGMTLIVSLVGLGVAGARATLPVNQGR